MKSSPWALALCVSAGVLSAPFTSVMAETANFDPCAEAARAWIPRPRTQPPCPIEGRLAATPIGEAIDFVADSVRNSSSEVVGLGRSVLRDLAEDGVSAGHNLDISKYGFVGLDTGVSLLTYDPQVEARDENTRSDKQSELQRAWVDKQAELGRDTVWLRQEVEADAGLKFNKNVPVGPEGLFIRVGMEAGKGMRFAVEKPYDRPTSQVILNAAKQQFKIPFTARDFDACVPGEKAYIEGPSRAVLRYGVGYGYGEEIAPGVEIGASASITRTKAVRGNLRTTIICMGDGKVRVRLSKMKKFETDNQLRLQAGLDLDTDNMELNLPDGLSVIDRVVGSAVEDLVQVKYQARVGDFSTDEYVQDYVLDLNNKVAREAYDGATRGDFTLAADLANCDRLNAVNFLEEASEHTDGRYTDRSLKAFALINLRSNAVNTDARRVSRTPAGIKVTDRFRLGVDRRRTIGREGSLEVESRTVEGAGQNERKVTGRGIIHERFTSRGDMTDFVNLARGLMSDDPVGLAQLNQRFKDVKPFEFKRPIRGAEPLGFLASALTGIGWVPYQVAENISHYGESRATMDFTMTEVGIANLMNASEDEVWAALGALLPDFEEFKTAAGRAGLKAELAKMRHMPGPNKGNGPSRTPISAAASQFRRYEGYVNKIMGLKKVEGRNEQTKYMRDIINEFRLPHLLVLGDSYDPIPLIALNKIAKPEGRRLHYRIDSEDLGVFEWTEDVD